jgi:hypothetical protein
VAVPGRLKVMLRRHVMQTSRDYALGLAVAGATMVVYIGLLLLLLALMR